MGPILISVIQNVFYVWSMMLFVWVILSWIPQISRHHPAVVFLERFVEPVMVPFRKLLPMPGGLDLSPLIAYFVLDMAVKILVRFVATAFRVYPY